MTYTKCRTRYVKVTYTLMFLGHLPHSYGEMRNPATHDPRHHNPNGIPPGAFNSTTQTSTGNPRAAQMLGIHSNTLLNDEVLQCDTANL